MAVEDELLNVILPYFESHQRQGQEEACELSLEASAKQLMTKISSLELSSGLQNLNLNDEKKDEGQPSEVEVAMAEILVNFVDKTVATEATSDLQDSVDRVLSLIAAFAIPFSTHVGAAIVSRAIQFSAVLLERVRAHACVLLGKVATTLKKLKEDGKGDTEFVDESLVAVEDALIPRMQDKGQAVRCHAIKAAGNFFVAAEDEEAHEDILEAILWSMAHDPSVSNRVAAVQSAPVNATTMDCLISRVRDTKEKVRAEALNVLGKQTQGISSMAEAQLVDLIRSGLTNRCALTKKAASKMICTGWMKSAKYDPILLLQKLNVLDNEVEANRALEVIMEAARAEASEFLEDLSDPELRAYRSGIEKAAVLIEGNDDELHPEKLFFLRARCKSVLDSKELTSAQKDSIASKLIPDVPLLCEVFGGHASKLMQAIDENDEDIEYVESFICLQLLQLAEVASLNEEGSRRHFAYVMKDVLSSIKTPDDLVEGCIQALRLTCVVEAEMVDAIGAVIDNIDKDEGGVARENEDQKTMKLVRILSVLTVFLETASSQLSSNPAVSDFAKYIVPSVTHEDTLVREAAVGCFGKLGLFIDEQTLVSEFKPILLEVASHNDEKIEIRAQALLALADWSMLFSECLAPCNIGDKEMSLSDVVRDMMDDSRISAVCVSSEVAAKLLFSGRVSESEWFAKLLCVFFDPRMADMGQDDEDIKEVGSPVRLQQLLTVFFPAICMEDSSVGRDALMGSILPLLELIYVKSPTTLSSKGRKSRKKVTWPVVKMVQFVCQVVDEGNSSEKDDATIVQGNTAVGEDPTKSAVSVAATEAVGSNSTSLLASIQLAEFLSKQSQILTDTETRNLCKLLGSANFDADEEEASNVKSLKGYMEDIGMSIFDETSLKALADLNEMLSEIEVESESDGESEESTEEGDQSRDAEEVVTDEEERGEDGSLEGDAVNDENEVDLSADLMKSLEEFRIDEPVILEDSFDKENAVKSKRTSKGKKNSNGSNTSRRSRSRRLGNAN